MKFVSKLKILLYFDRDLHPYESQKPGFRVQVLFYILKEWGAPAKLSESFGLAQIAGAVEVRSPTGGHPPR